MIPWNKGLTKETPSRISREELEEYVVEELVSLGLPDEEIDPEMNRIVTEALLQPNPREFATQQIKIIETRERRKALLQESEKLIGEIQEERRRG